jgi:hypothetical protein
MSSYTGIPYISVCVVAGITDNNCFLNKYQLPHNISKWINTECVSISSHQEDGWKCLKMNDKYELHACTNSGSELCHIILKWSWRKWTGFIWLWIGTVEGSCKHHNESVGSIKCEEFFLDQLKNYSSSLSERNLLHGTSH